MITWQQTCAVSIFTFNCASSSWCVVVVVRGVADCNILMVIFNVPAKTDNGQEAEIHVQCQPYQPSCKYGDLLELLYSCLCYKCLHTWRCKSFRLVLDEKKRFICLDSDPAGEFSLTCGSLGVINIIYAQTGHSNSSCEYRHWHDCAEDVSQMPAILQCMGEKSCEVPVLPTLLSKCSLNSNYWQVQYECIEGMCKVISK